MIFLANVNVYQNYQNPVPSTSRQSYSSIYTPPEFEPVKKKARYSQKKPKVKFTPKPQKYSQDMYFSLDFQSWHYLEKVAC